MSQRHRIEYFQCYIGFLIEREKTRGRDNDSRKTPSISDDRAYCSSLSLLGGYSRCQSGAAIQAIAFVVRILLSRACSYLAVL